MKQTLLFILLVVAVMALFVAILITLSLPANAHSETELEAWLETHDQNVDQMYRILPDHRAPEIPGFLDAALQDMKTRHPCSKVLETWTDTCEKQQARSSGSRGMGSNVEQWRGLVSTYAWDTDTALCLMSHESGGNPNAYNPSGASGLMQVLASWADNFGYEPADLFIPEVNLDIAYALYADGGWGHWSPWLRGECR